MRCCISVAITFLGDVKEGIKRKVAFSCLVTLLFCYLCGMVVRVMKGFLLFNALTHDMLEDVLLWRSLRRNRVELLLYFIMLNYIIFDKGFGPC